MSVAEQEALTAKDITNALRWPTKMNHIFLQNVVILDSRWEADAILVRPSRLYVEYEVKVSKSDYRKDFEKRMTSWGVNYYKHQMYANGIHYCGRWSKRPIPVPVQFYFVTPVGLVDLEFLPPHCGLIECERKRGRIAKRTVRSAPRLKGTKLDQSQIWNLAVKATSTLRRSNV